MVIFHSYVRLPEGNMNLNESVFSIDRVFCEREFAYGHHMANVMPQNWCIPYFLIMSNCYFDYLENL